MLESCQNNDGFLTGTGLIEEKLSKFKSLICHSVKEGIVVTTIFFAVVLLIPVYGLLIWAYTCPEDSILFGNRWMYKGEPELSKTAIRYTRFASMTLMIAIPIVILSFILEIYILRLAFVIIPIVLIFGFLRIYTKEE